MGLSRPSPIPDEQSEDHHGQAVSFFKVRVVKEQINLPYSCARRTTCCAVEADISIGIPPQSSEKDYIQPTRIGVTRTNHQVMSSVLGNNKSAQSNQFHPRKYRIGGTSKPDLGGWNGNQGT